MKPQGRTKFTFPKSERLTGKKSIEELFKVGSSFYIHPVILKYLRTDGTCNKVVFAVSKKSQKRAVDRNLVKRRMREVYRLNKHLLEAKSNSFFNLAFIYTDQRILSYKEIEQRLSGLLTRLDNLN